MPLNLVKLCVGVSSAEELRAIIKAATVRAGVDVNCPIAHWTRSTPTRAAEILGGGSIYWIMKGKIVCRQGIEEIRGEANASGEKRCAIVLSRKVIDVEPRARKPFQGWRYLEDKDSPRDVGAGATGDYHEMPSEMRGELAAMGLL